MSHPLSHRCPIPISPLCLTSHFYVCAEVFPRMNINVNINVLASVGAPLLDTQLHHVHVCTESAITLVQFIKHSKNNALWLHCSYIA